LVGCGTRGRQAAAALRPVNWAVAVKRFASGPMTREL
jgi:hypothetical protein